MLNGLIGGRPRPVSRITSIGCVKKFLLFEEVRLPVPMKIGKFRNFSRQYVAFSREADAALTFLSLGQAKE